MIPWKLFRYYFRATLWICIGFGTILVWSEFLNTSEKEFEMDYETVKENTKVKRELSDNASLPICVDNLLDRRSYNFTHWAKEPSNFLTSESTSPCCLLEYTKKRVVSCVDVLSRKYNAARDKPKMLHLVFIGDSRIRQQFFNFLKLIPNYDRTSEPNPFPLLFHGNIEVVSKMLNLHLSYKWLPLIDDAVMTMLLRWTTTNQDEAPYLLFLSMGIHHMLTIHGADFQLYQKKIMELGPVLNKLAEVTKVIWLNHYPTVDFINRGDASHNADVYEEKLQRCNEAVRRIFKNYDRIRIWDSSNPLTEEYVRGCRLSQRHIAGDYAASFTNCRDYVHMGNVALFRATQLLLNDMCNSHLYNQINYTVTSNKLN